MSTVSTVSPLKIFCCSGQQNRNSRQIEPSPERDLGKALLISIFDI